MSEDTTPVETKPKSKKKKERRKPPSIRARVRGQYTQMRQYLEEQFRENNPGKVIRWVFDPEHTRGLSKVRRRQLEGYQLVDGIAEDIELGHGQQGSTVRLGDTVMMAMDEEDWHERKEELTDIAQEDARRSKKAYDEAMRGIRAGEHEVQPTGDISGREQEFTVKETEA